MSKKDAQEFVGVLFASRDFAHKRHLASKSFAEHSALGEFYEGIIPLADSFSEAWQGHNLELLGDIPLLAIDFKDTSDKALKAQLKVVEEYRKTATDNYSPLINIFDEICALYLSTIYKLTFLK